MKGKERFRTILKGEILRTFMNVPQAKLSTTGIQYNMCPSVPFISFLSDLKKT
jgi:hypothetical protein